MLKAIGKFLLLVFGVMLAIWAFGKLWAWLAPMFKKPAA